MPEAIQISLIVLLPLLGFALLGLFGRRVFRNFSGIFGTLLLAATAGIAIYTALGYFFHYGNADGTYQSIMPLQVTWLKFTSDLSIDMGFVLDPISSMMLVVVTLVSLMVHLYSLGYMKGEERYPAYFAYLSLFTFSMLGLVLSSNIFQIYIFWELVGVSSYLLIGFYYSKPSAVAASKKAFIVTRFADLGFLVGILVLSFYAGTLDFSTLIERLTQAGSNELQAAAKASFLGLSALSWGTLLVFMGGAGKSAMFPLHIWLPDAMEGPTPVSALIHAATMVVAGVFLVARLFPVYAISTPEVLHFIGYVGAVSAIIAAIIACTQTDIKRVLAYSTMSQIGYMMFALGVSGYGGEAGLGFTASMFHLFTHAMFKALLFLAAGVIIHFVHSNEMRDMGGLRKRLPVTHISFLAACLAIAGIPPFAGFFSKEEILLAAYHGNLFIYALGLFTGGLTAFYMFRLYFSIFWRKPAGENHPGAHASEGSWTMLLPLVVLAVGAVAAGWLPFGKWVTSDGQPLEPSFHWAFSLAPVALAIAGIVLASWMYRRPGDRPERLASSLGAAYRWAHNKFYIDEIYRFVTRNIITKGIAKPAAWFDRNVVDGLVNAVGQASQSLSITVKKWQSGKVQQYALYFLAGAIGLALLFIYGWTSF